MIRRTTTLGLGAALLFLACGGCDHKAQPVTEAQAEPASAAAATTPPPPAAAPAPSAPAAQPTEEITMNTTKAAPEPPTGAPVPGDPNEIRRITIEEANALRESGRGVIVDVRDDASFNMAHIAGALHIPLDQLAGRLGELPRDKPIVTYCA